MRLSEPLVARLRAASQMIRAPEHDDDEPSTHASPFPATRTSASRPRETERRATTRPLPQPAAILSPSEPRLGSLEELIPESAPLQPPRWNHLDETSRIELPSFRSPAEDAMLAFQQTMQAFLQTQQEVMTAYLEGSADVFDRSVA